MHVFIDCREIKKQPSGVGIWCLRLIENLLQQTPNTLSILIAKNCDYDFKSNELISPHLNNRLHIYTASHPRSFVSWAAFWYEQTSLKKLLEDLKPDIYHATNSFGIPFFLDKKIKVILTIHDLIPLTPSSEYLNLTHSLLYRISLYLSVHRADHLVAISDKTAADIGKYLQIKTNITTIYDGIDSVPTYPPEDVDSTFNQLQSTKNIGKNAYIFYFGGFGPRRNTDTIIKVFTNLRSKGIIDSNVKIILSGRIEHAKSAALEQLSKIQKQNTELKIHDNVILTDYLTPIQKHALIKNSLFSINLSTYEGFGLTPLEIIQQHGTSFHTKVGIWYSYSGPNQFLIQNPYSVEEVCEKIQQYLKQPELFSSAKKAMEEFVGTLSWSKMATEYAQLYQQLLSR